MIKYLGIIFIGIGSVYGAYLSFQRGTKRLEFSAALLHFMKYIRYNIVNLKKPLPEIYGEYENDNITELVSSVKSNGWKSIENDKSVSEYLDGETKNALISFGSVIGKLPIEDEKRECDAIINLLCEKTKSLKETLPKMCKIQSSLFILGGIGLIITVI